METQTWKILVRFKGDNDFGVTLRLFAEVILANRDLPYSLVTPETIAEWFNKLAPMLYWAGQRGPDWDLQYQRDRHGNPTVPLDFKFYSEYLQIEPEDVYVDNPYSSGVTDMLDKAHEWFNGDSVVIDFVAHKAYIV